MNLLKKLVALLKSFWYRIVVVLVSIVLIVARIIWPDINVDWVTLALVVIAALALLMPGKESLLPQAMKVLPYIRRAKLAGVEIELNDEIAKLAQNVDDVQEKLGSDRPMRVAENFSEFQTEILNMIADPKASLLLLAAKIEQQVSIQLAIHNLRSQGEFIPMRRAIELGVQNGVFPCEVVEPFQEFWAIRNQVAHGLAFDVEPRIILSLISVGLNILRLVSVENSNGPSCPQ